MCVTFIIIRITLLPNFSYFSVNLSRYSCLYLGSCIHEFFTDLAQCDSSLAYRKVSHCERMYVGGRTSFVGCRKSSFFCSLVNKNSFCSLRLCHLFFQNDSKAKFPFENKMLVVKVSKSRRNYAKVKLFFRRSSFISNHP